MKVYLSVTVVNPNELSSTSEFCQYIDSILKSQAVLVEEPHSVSLRYLLLWP